jgi:hypothetical protein
MQMMKVKLDLCESYEAFFVHVLDTLYGKGNVSDLDLETEPGRRVYYTYSQWLTICDANLGLSRGG